MAKIKFIRFVGNVWINGKDVAAYKKEDGDIELRAETTGSKVIAKKTVTEEQFDQLLDLWTGGGRLYRGDARIATAALRYLGLTI